MISTRGRYALRAMLDLAEHGDSLVPMREVARRQDISLKYLERIMPLLTAKGLLEGVHGKGGGYRLSRAPEDYRVGEILSAAGEELAPVACLGCGAAPCERAAQCRTLPMWQEFDRMTNDYFDKITLADLLRTETAPDYVI